jgi:hypothetical protein
MQETAKGTVAGMKVSSTATGATIEFTDSHPNAEGVSTHYPCRKSFTAEERDQLIAILQRSESE